MLYICKTLWKEWYAKVKENDIKVGDNVEFTSELFTKKYSGKYKVVKVAKKYIYIQIKNRKGILETVGFDYNDMRKVK